MNPVQRTDADAALDTLAACLAALDRVPIARRQALMRLVDAAKGDMGLPPYRPAGQGLTEAEDRVLRILQAGVPIPVSVWICTEASGLSRPVVLAALDRLVESGRAWRMVTSTGGRRGFAYLPAQAHEGAA